MYRELKTSFHFYMPARSFAVDICKQLQAAGHIAYFAGGWVRDYIMQKPSDDIDIATSASVEQIQSLFPKTIPVGIAFGIVIVVMEGYQYEVATFRKDRGYVDGRRPTGFDPATPEHDAERRDFTINGMFYDPITEQIYDYVGGKEDIVKGIIRAIGNPHERIAEDRLRMMRAVRYATRFNFPIEEETERAIRANASQLLPAVAMERVWQEFKKMSQFAHFDQGLIALHRLGLLQTIFPILSGVPIQKIEKLVSHIPHFPKGAPTLAELLELFPGYSLEKLFNLCDYLKLSNEEREFVSFYHHAGTMFSMPSSWLEKLEKYEWATFYANTNAEMCLKILAAKLRPEKRDEFLIYHAQKQDQLSRSILRLITNNPIVKSQHLLEEGIKPGKKMGKLLKEAERVAANEELENPQEILNLLKKGPLWEENS